MARTRSVKPEFWDDEKLASISRDARLTFIGMWNHSDDYAVVKGNPLWLKNKIFPYDEIKPSLFIEWLKDLEKIGCIIPYEVNGEKYYYIRTFKKHQTINRPSHVKNPQPPDTLINDSLSTHAQLTDETETETETETERPPADVIPYKEIISYLNSQTGKNFDYRSKETQARIKARWGVNGSRRSLDDFKRVIDNKCLQWLNDEKMISFLRPETLFGTKFESYLNEIVPASKKEAWEI
jgi:uncharacterized phage protein (TIGR02220 family)